MINSCVFRLNKPRKDGSRPVQLDINFGGGKRWKVNVGHVVKDKDWDKKRRMVKPRATGAARVNQDLARIEALTWELLGPGSPEAHRLTKEQFEARLRGKPVSHRLTDLLEQYLQATRHKRVHSTNMYYKALLRDLRGYEEQTGATHVDDITPAWAAGFTGYLLEVIGNTNRTVNNKIDHLRSMLNWGARMGLCQPGLGAQLEKLKEPQSWSVSLSPDDLKKLAALELENYPEREEARDLLLFLCLTGLRFSDALRIRHHHLKDGWLELTQKKTVSRVAVPLVPQALVILRKYRYQFPVRSNTAYNKLIKAVCKLADMNQIVEKVTMRGNVREVKQLAKWKAIGSHTGRRTFRTWLGHAGVSDAVAKQLGGWASQQQADGYYRGTRQEVADEIARAFGGLGKESADGESPGSSQK